jgi:hypothetical protein
MLKIRTVCGVVKSVTKLDICGLQQQMGFMVKLLEEWILFV